LLAMIEVGGHVEVLRGRLRRFPDQLIDEWLGEIEELNLVPAGANLGWNNWEGSYRFSGGIDPSNPRSDPRVTYPIAEIGHDDPLLQSRSALTVGTISPKTSDR
ncbi:MAG: hypothetical protein ABMA01_04735, partial [Chthoniobacteraceae bacterium]